jgi:hypothetical protein
MNQQRYGKFLAAGAIILASCIQVGVALAAANDFKVGDWAQVFHDGQWIAVTVASPLDSGGYKVNFLLTVISVKANSSEIRHYTPTAAERQAVIDLRMAKERLEASAANIEQFLATQETGEAKPPVGGTIGAKVSGSVNDFKVGDWAQMNSGGQWIAVTIAKPLDSGSYYVNRGASVVPVNADASDIRHYTPTPEELKVTAETAAAKSKLPHGDTLGAKFGTREPAVCPNRKGSINAATAKQYFACDSEGVLFRDTLFLVNNLVVQVGSARPFNYNLDSSSQGIDTRAEVYDIRGSYNSYQCGPQSTMLNDFANTHNCSKFLSPTAQRRLARTVRAFFLSPYAPIVSRERTVTSSDVSLTLSR